MNGKQVKLFLVDGTPGGLTTADAVALGRSSNGRREWISLEGTFDQWESRGVDDAGS